MNQRSAQIFPLLLIGFLAGLSFWLERVVDIPEPRRDGKQRHDPDTIVENAVVRRFNIDGFLQSRLNAPHMEHYPDDDSSLIRKPDFHYFRPELPEIVITGNQARVTEKGDRIHLWENVVASRAAMPGRSAMVARTHDLFLRPNEGIGHTDSPVEITQDTSWMKGVGMDIDTNTSLFTLRSQVTGVLKRIKPQ